MSNKGLVITLIIILSIIVIAITLFFINLLIGKGFKINFNFFSTVSKKLVIDEEYDDNFELIKINSEAAKIEVLNSTDDKIRVKIYGNKKYISIDKDRELNIEVKEGCKGICFNRKITRIVIYMPKDYDKKITIKNNFGDIKISDFNKMKLNAKLNCGSIKIDDIYDAEIRNNLGDIKIKNVYDYIDLRCDCGDVKIENLNITKDSKVRVDLGSIKIAKTNEINIKAKTDLGDVKVGKNYKDSNINLELDNDCGDIKVN